MSASIDSEQSVETLPNVHPLANACFASGTRPTPVTAESRLWSTTVEGRAAAGAQTPSRKATFGFWDTIVGRLVCRHGQFISGVCTSAGVSASANRRIIGRIRLCSTQFFIHSFFRDTLARLVNRPSVRRITNCQKRLSRMMSPSEAEHTYRKL